MSYSLGIDLGTTFTSAAVHRDGRTSIVDLAARASTIPSIVYLGDDGAYLTGDAASRRTLMDPDRAATQFKRRFGDTEPLLLGGTPMSADQLSARLLQSVADQVSEREGGRPDHVAVTHPAGWGGYKLELLEQTLRAAGLAGATLLTEPEAAVLHYAGLERIPTDATVAVFDLGGGTFDAAVIRKTETGTEFLGRPDGIERLGGIDFDAAIFAFVAGQLDGALEQLDTTDPTNRSALERLRNECVEAKEALSSDDVADIAVLLPNVQTTVRITRAEFETAIRPSVAQAIAALERAIASAGIAPADLDAVLLAGGSSRIPLVAQMVTDDLGRPVAVDAHPKHVVALGAALAAGTSADVSAAVPPPIRPALGDTAAAAATAAATAAALPIIIPQTPTRPIDVQATPESTPTTAVPAATSTPTADPGATTVNPTVDADAGATAINPTAATGAGSGTAGAATTAGTHPTLVEEADARDSKRALIITLAVTAVLLVGGGLAFALTGGDDSTAAPGTAPAVSSRATVTTVPGSATTLAPASTVPPATATTPATPAPTTVAPTPAPPPYPADTRRGEITGITTIDGTYRVSYDTVNFEPLIGPEGTHHLHFHWNTEDPASVGTGSDPMGDWIVWDLDGNGDKVFDQFSPALVPDGATQICVVVADHLHAVDTPEWVNETVSCIDLV